MMSSTPSLSAISAAMGHEARKAPPPSPAPPIVHLSLLERIFENTFVLTREGTAQKVAQIVEGVFLTLILVTPMLNLSFLLICLAVEARYEEPPLAGAIDGEYGEKRGRSPFSLSSMINNRTIISGASRHWDAERIKKGKLATFREQCGAESWLFHTKTGDALHGCYFDAKEFRNHCEKRGGTLVSIGLNHPFLRTSKLVKITAKGEGDTSIQGVEISREAASNEEFQEFCRTNEYVTCRKHQASAPPSLDPDRFLLIRAKDLQWFAAQDCSIEPSACFDKRFRLFDPQERQMSAYAAQHGSLATSSKPAQFLRTMYCERTPFFYKDAPLRVSEASRPLACYLQDKTHYSFLKPTLSEEVDPSSPRKVILLSMNQTASFFKYSEEIYTFLSLGFNVVTYDHAGKGLSRGHNTSSSLVEGGRTVVEFLQREKGFAEESIILKGQCSGALPLAELTHTFPRASLWVDQAPSTYSSFLCTKVKWLDALLSPLVRLITPRYNISHSLALGEGRRLYTIGTLDKNISQEDQKMIRETLETRELSKKRTSLYQPLRNGRHVTPWFLYPESVVPLLATLATPLPPQSPAGGKG